MKKKENKSKKLSFDEILELVQRVETKMEKLSREDKNKEMKCHVRVL